MNLYNQMESFSYSKKSRALQLMVILALIFVLPSVSIAVPANPSVTQLRQPDGSLFDIQIVGDEWNNRIETKSGFTIEKAQDGSWRYVTGYNEKKPVLSDTLANDFPPSGLGKHIHQDAGTMLNPPGGQSGESWNRR